MTAKDFSEAMGALDLKYIDEAQGYAPKKRKSPLKWIAAVAAVAACAALTVVLTRQKPAQPPVADTGSSAAEIEVEIAANGVSDGIRYNTIMLLEDACDIAVTGVFTGDAQQGTIREHNGFVTYAQSENYIEITGVLKGDSVKVGERIKISQGYYYPEGENKLVSFDLLTPMNKGDSWIFFLIYNEETGSYRCAGDVDGRYPLPVGEMGEVYLKAAGITAARDKYVIENGQAVTELVEADGRYCLMQNGEIYYLSADKVQPYLDYEEQLLTLRDSIAPEDFGLYPDPWGGEEGKTQNINLPLYCAIVEKYDLYK